MPRKAGGHREPSQEESLASVSYLLAQAQRVSACDHGGASDKVRDTLAIVYLRRAADELSDQVEAARGRG